MSVATKTVFDSEAFVIEVEEISAGIVLRERGGFRFIAVDPRFRLLDGSRFRGPSQAENAARTLLKATRVR